jgi:diaminohydroxyphosphoribosylaminopyrimidine deaminase/5-amino-6-(5-phosphoribosylamino)uracil reductase
VAAGLARVVAPLADPDPRVGGKGFDRLRAAGVAVVTGVVAEQACRAQAGHLSRIAANRPFVLLKLAVSADDAIGRAGEGQVPVTGDIARRHVQALRSRFDAILVGRGTIEADDPALTCRLPGLEEDRSPVRIVLDSQRRLARDRRVFQGLARTWILNATTDEAAGPHRMLKVSHGASGALDLRATLTRLAGEGITRLIVEGGAHVARSFLEADLVDEVMLFRSPVCLGGNTVPALAGLPLMHIEESERFRRVERRIFGRDRMTRYERAR